MTTPHLHDIDAVIGAAEVLNRGLATATVSEITRAIKLRADDSADSVTFDEWSFSDAIALVRVATWPASLTAAAIAAAFETAAAANKANPDPDKWSFSAAVELVASRSWPTTSTEAALMAAVTPEPSTPLFWHKRASAEEIWNSDDGRWRVTGTDAGYTLAAAYLATFDPPVLATLPRDVDAFDTAALLTRVIDSEGFDALRSLVTYWQNAYDAQHLSRKDARAESDHARAVLVAVRTRTDHASRVLGDMPGPLDATQVADIAKHHLRLIIEALDGDAQVQAVRCVHCGNEVTEQTDGTWFALDGSITLCAPNLPHEPVPPRHEVFIDSDGQNSIRLTRAALEESHSNSFRLWRQELDAYKQATDELQDENISLRAERDYLAAELESARATITSLTDTSTRQIEDLQSERDAALAKNSVTAEEFDHRSAYAKKLAESGMDPEWADKYKTLSTIFDTCAEILRADSPANSPDGCLCVFIKGLRDLYVYDPGCPVHADITAQSIDSDLPTDEFSYPFYKTTIVIWSDYNPAGFSIQELGRDADGGGSIATSDVRGPANPDVDPTFAGAEDFFEYTPKSQR
jgi:hypothetical protein